MNKTLTLALLAAFTLSAPVFAADAPATNSQNDKMKVCNEKAANMKGDERKAFMSNCLSAKPEPPPKENKMAMCNKKTAGLDKEARSKAQSECMKGPG